MYRDRRQYVCNNILQPNELKEQHNGNRTAVRGSFIKHYSAAREALLMTT